MSDERETRPADEQQDDTVWPAPAQREVEKAGGQLLPGFDEVAERPAQERKSWSA